MSVDFVVKCNLDLLMEVTASHLEEEQQVGGNDLLKKLELIIHDSGSSSGSGNGIPEFIEEHKNVINHYSETAKEEVLKSLETIKTHALKGCLDGIMQHAKFDKDKRFHKLHALLQKWTSNVRLGVTMVNAVVSVGFHKYNISNGVLLSPVNVPNRNVNDDDNDDDNNTKVLALASLDTLISRICSIKLDDEEVHCSNSDAKNQICGYVIFLKCFKNVSHCAPDLIRSSHLLPHFVSSTQVISIPCFFDVSEINADYATDVEIIQCLVNGSNQNVPSFDNDVFLSCFIRHLSTLSALDEYRGHLNSVGTRFGLDFTSVEETVDKVQKMLQSEDNLDGLAYVERLSRLFSVVFLFVTNIKRFPLVPVYPDTWIISSLFVLVLIEEGHTMVMLDPVSLADHQDQFSASAARTSVEKKKYNCRCGRGQAEKNLPPKCVNHLEGGATKKYPCRCLCFRAGEPCSNVCDCRACANPFGAQQTKKRSRLMDQSKLCRQRNTHDAQKSLRRSIRQFHSARKTYNKQKNQWNFAEHTLFEYSFAQLVSEYHLKKDDKERLFTWSDSSVVTDRLHDKYESFRHLVYAACMADIEPTMIREKSKCDLEKRYMKRQESIYTYF